jgi:PAS domain S-box-containing protein/TyrR family helix-turn-helix protein
MSRLKNSALSAHGLKNNTRQFPRFNINAFQDIKFFQATIDQMPFGILITQPPGNRIFFINEDACRIFGIPKILHETKADFKDVFFGAGGKCFYTSKDILQDGAFSTHYFAKDFCVARRLEVQIQQPAGKKRYVSVSASSIVDKNKQPMAMISILEDINSKKENEIKENEIKIRQNLERLEYALTAAVDGLWEWNIPKDSGFLSPRYHEIYGFKEGEFPGDIKFWYSMLHPDDKEPALTALTLALKSKKDNYTSTYRMKTKKGTYQWIQSKAVVTRRAADGSVKKMVGTHQDISREVALENKLKKSNLHLKEEVFRQTRHLKESNQQLETILNSSSEGIWVCDGDGVILKANKAASETIGCGANALVGKTIAFLVDKGFIDRSITMEVLAEKKQITRMQKAFQTRKDLLVTGTPVFDDAGNIKLIIINEIDLTALNNLKQEIEAAQIKSRQLQDELNQISMLELGEENIIATSKEMKQVIIMALKLAKMDVSNILILGDSGTGKSLLAKFIHNSGLRKNEPFLEVNCAALPETLLEAELFGYEKGAFTGAQSKGKIGFFELAQNGTIFLDEIGELSLNVQAKILKCIEDKEIMHLGGLKVIKINCNIITATNVDLVKKAKVKAFREDLYYRLNIFTIHIPSLKSRHEDLLELSLLFLKKYNKKYNKNKTLSTDCLNRIQQYDFPGNIRELQNRIQKAVVITDNDIINDLIDFDTSDSSKTAESFDSLVSLSIDASGITAMLTAYEKEILTKAFKQYPSTRKLAIFLKTSQSTIVRRFQKHGLAHLLPKKT